MKIAPSHHEKIEWARMAQAAYAIDRNDIGHRFSTAATLRNGEQMDLARFDALQAEYREWLISGFRSEEDYQAACKAQRDGFAAARSIASPTGRILPKQESAYLDEEASEYSGQFARRSLANTIQLE